MAVSTSPLVSLAGTHTSQPKRVQLQTNAILLAKPVPTTTSQQSVPLTNKPHISTKAPEQTSFLSSTSTSIGARLHSPVTTLVSVSPTSVYTVHTTLPKLPAIIPLEPSIPPFVSSTRPFQSSNSPFESTISASPFESGESPPDSKRSALGVAEKGFQAECAAPVGAFARLRHMASTLVLGREQTELADELDTLRAEMARKERHIRTLQASLDLVMQEANQSQWKYASVSCYAYLHIFSLSFS